MTAAPLVSVVIPVYERRHCVMDAVRSVLDQTHPNVECVVVDDGSTDGSHDVVVAASQHEPRIRAFAQSHAGVSAARNLGVRKVRGDFITFLDSDDVMVAERIRHQLDLLAEESCDLVIARCASFSVAGAPVPSWVSATDYCVTAMLLETRHIREIGGFDETLLVGEDLDLAVRLRGAGLRMVVSEDVLTIRRYFGDNLTSGIGEDDRSLHEAIRRHIARRRAAAES